MSYIFDAVRFLHILSVVFMSAPLYNLIVVNERARLGKAPFAVDRYFENIIRGATTRCYVYQLTVLVSGIFLVALAPSGWSALFANPVLMAKSILLLGLMGLLSFVHFGIQPAIESLLAGVSGQTIPDEIAAQVAPLRLRRKRLAAVCLFIVISLILLGLQVYQLFGFKLNLVLFVLAALFAWRVYRTRIRFGWL